jgi:NitT/TauT family transport system permease protein
VVKPRAVVAPLVVLVVLLAAWALLARLGAWPPYLFPAPGDVVSTFSGLAGSGRLLPNLAATATRLLVGFAISVAVGTLMAFVLTRFPPLRRGVKPYLLGLQSLPGIAWTPFAILWFGFGDSALIFVTTMGSVFAVTIAYTDALGLVPREVLWAGRTMGSRGMHLITRVGLPAVVPHLVTGAKQCWAFAWRSLLGAEIVFASVGLGFLLNQGREFFLPGQVVAVMLLTLALGAIVEILLFSVLERRLKRRWGLQVM